MQHSALRGEQHVSGMPGGHANQQGHSTSTQGPIAVPLGASKTISLIHAVNGYGNLGKLACVLTTSDKSIKAVYPEDSNFTDSKGSLVAPMMCSRVA